MNSINNLLQKRKNNIKLSFDDFSFLVKNYSSNKISEKEMSVFIKDIFYNDLSDEETLEWFDATLKQTEEIDLLNIDGFKVDKHSTGGIGDKVTLILLPLLKVLGIKCYKLSGRFLGHTGGTITKLNSFKGINLNLSKNQFKEIIKHKNLVLSEVMSDISNFEKKLYLLRTKINTTQSVPLIFNSIMIKKMFLKTDAILIDLKFGSGSLFKTTKEVERFQKLLIKLSKKYKRKIVVLVTNMEQPLGFAIGNKIEILEVLDILEGKKYIKDLNEIVVEFAAQTLIISHKMKSLEKAREFVKEKLKSKEVLKEFKNWIESFGGDFESINKNREINTKYKIEIKSKKDGYVKIINNSYIGKFLNNINNASVGGHEGLDYDAGIIWYKKNNVYIKKGEIIFTFFTNKKNIKKYIEDANKLFEIVPKKFKTNKNIIKSLIFK